MENYIEIQFTQKGKQARIRVNLSTAGQREGKFSIPFTAAQASQNIMKAMRAGELAPVMEEIGNALYQAMVKAGAGEALKRAVDRAREERTATILQLRFDENCVGLAGLPWELLHDGRRALLPAVSFDISRYVTYPESVAPLRVETLPIRILQVASSPKDLAKLDIARSMQELETVINGLKNDSANPPIVLEHLPEATYDALLARMEQKPQIHILHFDGHGGIVDGKGILCFENPEGRADHIDSDALSVALAGRVSLVVLNACETAGLENGMTTLFEGLAPGLIQAGIPAVVGMQFPVLDTSANRFIGAFYKSIATHGRLPEAMLAARRWLFREQSWFIPVLYLRSDDPRGQLFVIGKEIDRIEEMPGEKLGDEIQRLEAQIREREDKIRSTAGGLEEDTREVDVLRQELTNIHQQMQALQTEFEKISRTRRTGTSIPLQPKSFSVSDIEEMPYPIAVKCLDYNQGKDDIARFVALDELLTGIIKYLAAIALAQFRQSNPRAPELRTWLLRLSRSHLSEWMILLTEIEQYYVQDMEHRPALVVIIADALGHRLRESSALASAYKALMNLLSQPMQNKPAVRDFLNALVNYRQLTWAGGTLHLPPEFFETLLPSLQLALKEMMDDMAFIANYPLRYVNEQKTGKDGVEIQMIEWKGAGVPKALIETTKPGKLTVKNHRLYLCAPDGLPLLNTHPLLIHFDNQLYFLEAYEDAVTFRPCHTGKSLELPHGMNTTLRSLYQERGDNVGEKIDDIEEKVESISQNSNEPILPPKLDVLLLSLSDDVRGALEIGLGESLRIGQFWLGIEFLLMGFSKIERSALSKKLTEIGINAGEFRGAIRGLVQVKDKDWRKQRDAKELGEAALSQLQEIDPAQLPSLYGTDQMTKVVIAPRLLSILREAVRKAGDGKVSDTQILLEILHHTQCLPVNLLLGLIEKAGRDPREWIKELMQGADAKPEQPDGPTPGVKPRALPRSPVPLPKSKGILQTGRDLTALAQAGQLRPAVGESARKAMTQIGLILQQTQANNPILLGDPGVGKTAIAEGLAWRLVNDKEVIAKLAGLRIIDISPNALMAGTKYRGDLEERVQQLLAEVQDAKGQIVVFIDEIHTILGGKAEGGLGALSDALKPALARGEFPCIGATTVGEYRRYIESDPALARRFTPVWLDEPSEAEAREIAKQVAQEHLAPSHGVEYPEGAIAEAVRLSIRYIHDEFLPGKAIKLLDQAGPRVTMGGSLRGIPVDKDQAIGGAVTVEIIRQIVSERTGIPLTSLSKDDKAKLLGLEDELKKRIKGQDEAVKEVVRVVKRARAGLSDPRRPQGVFLFAGPTGVGKTELALALAEALFDEEDAILRLDMSEYLEMHQISRLIGSPPGYVGHEEEGQLTGRLRRHPYSVILLDEIEKAHKDVQHLFLQLFDAGRITDSRGHIADGRNTIFIMTTNLGAKEAIGFLSDRKSYEEQLQTAIEQHFSAEFLNRVNCVVYFKPLNEYLLLAIFDKFFAQAVQRFKEQNIGIEVSDSFKRDLCQRYADDKRGARPLQRAIEDEIIAPLTDKLLKEEIRPGTKVFFVNEGKVLINEMPQSLNPKIAQKQAQARGQEYEPDEKFNLAILSPLQEEFNVELGTQRIEVAYSAKVQEILCSPYWTESRNHLSTDIAFERLVRVPLQKKIIAGEVKAGDHVEVIWNIDKMEFKINSRGES